MLLISGFCDPSVKGSVNSVEEVSTYTIQRILHTQIFRTTTLIMNVLFDYSYITNGEDMFFGVSLILE